MRDFFEPALFPIILGNSRWTVQPCICFLHNVPLILTCRWHKNGLRGRVFHPPKNPNGVLPSNTEDQLAPAVIQSRTIQQDHPHKFSDSYQMSRMHGQFSGVDTLWLMSHHTFSSSSHLQCRSESLVLNH